MTFSLEPKDVKTVIEAFYDGKPFNPVQFLYYHHERNYFNVHSEIKKLKYISDDNYEDNQGYIWEEQSNLKNPYHMPKGSLVKSILGLDLPYSRKFLRDDNNSGLEGEFEMIIRHDGKRIDALTHEGYQETYNFGRSRNWLRHYRLDMLTHDWWPEYTYKHDMGCVWIDEPISRTTRNLAYNSFVCKLLLVRF